MAGAQSEVAEWEARGETGVWIRRRRPFLCLCLCLFPLLEPARCYTACMLRRSTRQRGPTTLFTQRSTPWT